MSAIGQLSYPVRLTSGGQLATTTQDTDQFAAEQVEVLCLTPPGWLPTLPTFGLADQRFTRGGPDIGHIERQIQQWVPDAEELVDRDLTALDRALATVGVQVKAA